MRLRRRSVGFAAAILLFVSIPVSASFFDVTYELNKPSIKIINNDSNWQIKVWAYEHRGSTVMSCQTLGWSSERERTIDPKVVNDVYAGFGAEVLFDHCGNYSILGLWFRVYHNNTGEQIDFNMTFWPTGWGDTWTWNGRTWSCSGPVCG